MRRDTGNEGVKMKKWRMKETDQTWTALPHVAGDELSS